MKVLLVIVLARQQAVATTLDYLAQLVVGTYQVQRIWSSCGFLIADTYTFDEWNQDG